MLSEPLNDDDAETRPVGHTVVWQRIDEYLVLLKRLWSNDRPFDHEGAFYSIKGGYVPRKGPHGADVTIRMGGQSGTALKVAGRHADVFELAPGSIDEIRQLMERARSAAAEHGRAGKIRFALPVRIRPEANASAAGHKAVDVSGPPAQVALSLLPYAALGIHEFMIVGVDRPREIATVGRETIALLRNSLARRDVDVAQPGVFASRITPGYAYGRLKRASSGVLACLAAQMRQGMEDGARIRQRAKDAVFDRDHMERGFMRLSVAAGAGIRDRQALEVAVAGFAQCRVDADIGRASRKQEMRNALRTQDKLEIRVGEGAVAGLVDDDVLRRDVDLWHDLEARA